MDEKWKYHCASRVRISIPSFHRVFSNIGKEYTVYKVVIAKPGGSIVIEKRYSEFHKLHKKLKESQKLRRGRSIEFPPKRLNPSAATKEERRRKLERYMEMLSDEDPISNEVLAFLGISLPPTTFNEPTNEVDNASSCNELGDFSTKSTHQPTIGFLRDPFLNEQPGNSMSNVLLEGILDGIYENYTASSTRCDC